MANETHQQWLTEPSTMANETHQQWQTEPSAKMAKETLSNS
jgi:hypothetical protein